MSRRYPAGWVRVDDRSRGKLGAIYAHPSGWQIQHCGHPTALWPYALYDPAGDLVLAPNGRAWGHLGDAMLHAIRTLDERSTR